MAEDIKRAIQRAVGYVGLKLHKVRMILGEDQQARIILGGGKPGNWPHELPAISVEVLVATNGDIEPVRILCKATDENPVIAAVGGALSLTNCRCDLVALPGVLKEVWAEREELMAMRKAGEQIRSYSGRFRWEWTALG